MDNSVLPLGRLHPDQVKAMVRAADAAPTWGIARPWKLICHPNLIQMQLTNGLDLGIATPEQLAVCGMALLNIRLAIQSCGVESTTLLTPDSERSDLVASVRMEGVRPVSDEQLSLESNISKLNAQAAEFLPIAIPAHLSAEFRHAARTEQAWVAAISGTPLGEFGRLVSREQQPLISGAEPLVMVVGTLADDPVSRLRAGKALERILLIATMNGLAAAPLKLEPGTQATRESLRGLVGGGLWPQVVFRIGIPAQLHAAFGPAPIPLTLDAQ